MNGSIGPPLPMPSSSEPQPHWKIATIRPNEAPAAKTFMAAAVSGMTMQRKATISSRNDSPMTARKKIGILACSTLAKSTWIAVMP